MLLRVGVIAMSFSIMLALMLIAILAILDNSEEIVATEAAVASPEPTTEQAYQDLRDKMLDLPSSEPIQPSEHQQEPKPVSQSESVSEPESAAASGPEPEPGSGAQSDSEQEQDSLPLAGSDWPLPSAAEIKQASQPRHYD